MTTPDRNEDLIRLMLERRAGSPAPGGLRHDVAESVGRTRQVRRGPAWSAPLELPSGRLALVAAAVLVPAVTVGVLVASGLLQRRPSPTPSQPAIVSVPSPSAFPATATPEPSPSESTEAPSATPDATALPADTIAVVTRQGDGLRVRSEPHTGASSKKLNPLLRTGSRMLVVDGPVSADGYTWYEVMADEDLFGWVATGKDGEPWIEPTEARCADDLDESALWTVDAIDFLVCYGDTPVDVRALTAEPMGPDIGPAPPCQWADVPVSCKATPRWLFDPFSVVPVGNDQRLLEVRARPAVRNRLAEVPPDASLTLTVARDDPQATSCRVVDGRDRDVIPRDEALTRCRLRLTVRDVAWDPAARFEPDTLAEIASEVQVRDSPDGALVGTRYRPGDEVLVIAGPVVADEFSWYAVVGAGEPTAERFGWIPSRTANGAIAIQASTRACPPPTSPPWGAAVPPAVLLACYGGAEITANALVYRQDPPPGGPGLCDTYRMSTVGAKPCVGTPTWLAGNEVVYVADPQGQGDMVVWFDPSQVDVGVFPSTWTRMRITGSFAHPAAAECRVADAETDTLLVEPMPAAADCRMRFVLTDVVPLP